MQLRATRAVCTNPKLERKADFAYLLRVRDSEWRSPAVFVNNCRSANCTCTYRGSGCKLPMHAESTLINTHHHGSSIKINSLMASQEVSTQCWFTFAFSSYCWPVKNIPSTSSSYLLFFKNAEEITRCPKPEATLQMTGIHSSRYQGEPEACRIESWTNCANFTNNQL